MKAFTPLRSRSVLRSAAHRDTRRSLRPRRLSLAAALLLGVSVLSACTEVRSEASDAAAYPPPGRLVDVGGFQLHLNCVGSGGPTVVIDAGLGAWSTPWHPVQTAVAGTTQVCTYDRAGLGYSGPGPLPRDAAQFAGELHTLLHRAGLPGPYVLAGHSLGGLTVRVFAKRYPQEVAGLVFVDSMGPDTTRTPTPAAAPQPQGFNFLSAAARLGLVRLLAGPLGLSEGIPPEDAGAYTALSVTPRYFQTVADETAGIPASLHQAGEVTALGDLPLTVVSRGLNSDPVWNAKQADLLRLSSNSTQVIARHSGHNVELDEPQVAAAAIVDLVKRVR